MTMPNPNDAPVTRGEFNSRMRTLTIELVKTQADVRDIKDKMHGMATKTDIDRVLVAIDRFAGKAESYDRAKTLHGHALTEAQVTLKDHERRIKRLESGAA